MCRQCRLEKELVHGLLCKDCRNQYNRNLRNRNKEETNKKNRDYYHKNKIKKIRNFLKDDLEWQKKRSLKKYLIRRARLANAEIDLTFEQWEDIQWLYNYKCVYCQKFGDTMDHVIPLSKNGAHAYWNVVPACRSCNSRKGNR